MNYVVKDLPEIKLEMESDNTVIDNKKKIKHTSKNIIVCGTRIEKGTSSYNPLIDNIKDTSSI